MYRQRVLLTAATMALAHAAFAAAAPLLIMSPMPVPAEVPSRTSKYAPKLGCKYSGADIRKANARNGVGPRRIRLAVRGY